MSDGLQLSLLFHLKNAPRNVCRMAMLSQKHHVKRLFNWIQLDGWENQTAGFHFVKLFKQSQALVLIANHQQMKDLPGMPMSNFHRKVRSSILANHAPKNSTEHCKDNRPWTPQKPKNSLSVWTTFSSHMDAAPQRPWA